MKICSLEEVQVEKIFYGSNHRRSRYILPTEKKTLGVYGGVSWGDRHTSVVKSLSQDEVLVQAE
jgi:hypothetical protein